MIIENFSEFLERNRKRLNKGHIRFEQISKNRFLLRFKGKILEIVSNGKIKKDDAIKLFMPYLNKLEMYLYGLDP